MSEQSVVSRSVHRNALWLAGTLMATVLSGCETVNSGFPPQADFKTMPSDQVLALLRNANQVTVTTAGTDIDADWWLKERIDNCNRGDTKTGLPEDSCYQVAGHANPVVVTETNGAVSFYALMRGQKATRNPNDGEIRFAIAALLRGCGLYASSPDTAKSYSCSALGGLLFAIGNSAAAATVWEQADGCYSFDRESPINRCVGFALLHSNLYSSEPQRLIRMARQACNSIHDRDSCEFLSGQGQRVDMNAVVTAENDRGEANREFSRQAEADSERAKADAQASRNRIFSALQSMPGGSDPNAILTAGNQQAASMRAIGDANTVRQQQDAQMRQASQRATTQTTQTTQTTGQGSNIVAGPATTYRGSAQVVTSSQGTKSNVGNPVAGAELSNSPVASNAIQYSTPLASSCVRQFWDPKTNNWLSFENDCGQPIYVSYIPHHPGGWAMGGGMHLALGHTNNTGLSSDDLNKAGGFEIYVCPIDSVPVDLNGNVLNRNVTQYRCKSE